MQQNLTDKILLELDMIRILSNLSILAIKQELEYIQNGYLELIFEDIEKRSWTISEFVEKMENFNKV